MKYLLAIALLALCISTIFSTKIHRRYRYSHSRHLSRTRLGEDLDSPCLNFFYQAALAFVGIDPKNIAACVNGLKDAATYIKAKVTGEAPMAIEEPPKEKEQTTWGDTILSAAGTIISWVCNWKDALKDLIKGLVTDARRRYRRNRLFFQGKRATFKWCLITCLAKKAYDAIKNAVHTAVNWLGKAITSIGDALKAGYDKILAFGGWIVTKIQGLWTKITTLIPALKTMKNIFDGLRTCAGVAYNLYQTVTDLIEKLPLYFTPLGIGIIIKNILCSASDIIDIYKSIRDAWNEAAANKKWGLYGKAMGLIFKVIIAAKAQPDKDRRRMRRRRLI